MKTFEPEQISRKLEIQNIVYNFEQIKPGLFHF